MVFVFVFLCFDLLFAYTLAWFSCLYLIFLILTFMRPIPYYFFYSVLNPLEVCTSMGILFAHVYTCFFFFIIHGFRILLIKTYF